MKFTKKYAIFDMDGTLVDSMKYWDQVCCDFIREQNIYEEGLMETVNPMTLEQMIAYLNSRFGLHLSAEVMIGRMRELMQTHYQNDVTVKPGAIRFLDALAARGVPMCVASTTPTHLIELCLDRLDLRKYFSFAVSAETVGKGKTEPDIYLYAAERLGGKPENTMVFEDAMQAGWTAQKAGFSVTAVYDETSCSEWETFCGFADVVVADWNDVTLEP